MAAPLETDRDGPRSQRSLAYRAIREDILAGVRAPGAKLRIQELAAELRVSPGAVREALSQLVPEQLVVARDQHGFAVAPLSIADLEDLTDLRCAIEAIALRRSVERGDVDWEAALVAAAHRLQARPQRAKGKPRRLDPGWVASHAAFHTALVAACGSRRLLTLHAQLYQQSERYRGLSAHLLAARDVAAEHRELVELALARDADGLVEATLRHIRRTTALIVGAARKQPTLIEA